MSTATPATESPVGPLRYSNAVLNRVEFETGKTAAEHLDAIAIRNSLVSLSALVWAGLLHAEPDLTMADAVERIDLAEIAPVTEAVSEALEMAYGGGPEGKERAAPKNRAAKRAAKK